MEHRDYNYYEAHAATINLEGITSSAKNANILQRLRDGDYKLSSFSLGRKGWESFYIREDDDMGWLGYFIGKSVCLQRLGINYLPNGEEGHAFAEGIAHNQSLRNININNLSNDGFTSIMRALHGVTQLEGLTIWDENNVDPDGWSELGTLLESGVCKVKQLDLSGNHYIGNEGMDIFSNGLRGIGSSLKGLMLNNDSIGNDGLLALVEALHTCTSLETLNLNSNDFSSAVTGLGSLSDWLQRDEVNLDELNLQFCSINDEGLHALEGGATNQCRELNLDGNESITTLGLSYLSDSIRSNSCPVMILDLQSISIGDTGLEVLAQGLLGNQSLTCLYLDDFGDDISVTSAGWVAFSTALCDTSSVNSTYLSNHTLCDICAGGDGDTVPHQDISRYLRLNEEHPQYAARCKILMKHRHLDMTPFLHWGLKCLPLAVAWFERAKPCTSLTIYDYDPDLRRLVLDEADEAFESRELTAMYEFLHGMPLEVMKSRKELIVAAHDDNDEIAMIDERYREALEQRDRKIEQLEEEIMRLRGL